MRKMTSYADGVVAAIRELGLRPEQEVTILGIAARMICQERRYAMQHVSPVGHARKALSEGFDRPLPSSVDVGRLGG